jgi:transposase InsO family protein
MRQHGIVSQRQRRFKTTTDSQHAYPIAPNLLHQQFVAAQRNQTWLADTLAPVAQAQVSPTFRPMRAGSI